LHKNKGYEYLRQNKTVEWVKKKTDKLLIKNNQAFELPEAGPD